MEIIQTPEAIILQALASIFIWASTGPQAYLTLRTRLTRDISLVNLIFCVGGLAMWTTYAIVTRQIIFAIGDGVDMAMWTIVLVIKIRNVLGKRELIPGAI